MQSGSIRCDHAPRCTTSHVIGDHVLSWVESAYATPWLARGFSLCAAATTRRYSLMGGRCGSRGTHCSSARIALTSVVAAIEATDAEASGDGCYVVDVDEASLTLTYYLAKRNVTPTLDDRRGSKSNAW
jgi:hypothetical protein